MAKFSVTFNSPQSGFMSVGLRSGRKRFMAAMAHKPYPSLEELMQALEATISGKPEAIVRWNEEPEEFDFFFRRSNDRVRFEVVRYPNHKRAAGQSKLAFTAEGTVNEICLPFFDTLKEMTR